MQATGLKWGVAAVLGLFLGLAPASGGTTVFFDATQATHLVAEGTTSDTVRTEGYLFTFTRDKLFTGGVGLTNPIGRAVRVPWPVGLEAQAVTAGPNPGGARIDVSREDGQPFAIASFTARLLANTAGAGGAIEIMPMRNGEDGLPDPLPFNASGISGNSFSYDTPQLAGYDAYKIKLYVDFALTRLTVIDASVPPPTLGIGRLDAQTIELSWPEEAVGYVLERASSLTAPVWLPVTEPVVVGGGLNRVQMGVAEAQQWFRLRK